LGEQRFTFHVLQQPFWYSQCKILYWNMFLIIHTCTVDITKLICIAQHLGPSWLDGVTTTPYRAWYRVILVSWSILKLFMILNTSGYLQIDQSITASYILYILYRTSIVCWEYMYKYSQSCLLWSLVFNDFIMLH